MGEDRQQAYWDTPGLPQYAGMIRRHPTLWEHVEKFIHENRVRSVLEVGCGMIPPARKWVMQYAAIDRNPKTDAVHGDFTKIDVSFWHGVDLLLATEVIEHISEGYETFLLQVLRVEPRWALISFFNGLHHRDTALNEHKSGFFCNRYSGDALRAWLDGHGCNYDITTLTHRDIILTMRIRGVRSDHEA